MRCAECGQTCAATGSDVAVDEANDIYIGPVTPKSGPKRNPGPDADSVIELAIGMSMYTVRLILSEMTARGRSISGLYDSIVHDLNVPPRSSEEGKTGSLPAAEAVLRAILGICKAWYPS